MYLKNSTFALIVLHLVFLNLFTNKRNLVLSKNHKFQRLETLTKALEIRYGILNNNPDPYTSMPLFEKLSDGFTDDIAQEALCELGQIHLLGYKRLFVLRYDVKKATDYFSRSAQLGHPKSLFMLSFLHFYDIKDGPGVDTTKALRYLTRSAAENYVPAILALSYHYLYREQTPNLKAAIKLYKRIFDQNLSEIWNDVIPLEDLKLSRYSLKNYEQDMKNYLDSFTSQTENRAKVETKASKKGSSSKKAKDKTGDPNPQQTSCSADQNKCELSTAQSASDEKKQGQQKDKKSEMTDEFQQILSEQEKIFSPENLAPSLLEIGAMYLNGEGVPRNYQLAVKLLERAVSLGSTEAANILGQVYFFGMNDPEEGRPVHEDKTKSLKFFKIAALSHDAQSIYFLGEILCDLAWKRGPVEYLQEMKNAFRIFRISADFGYAPAYARCAQMLERGLGVEANLLESALDYKTCAENGTSYRFVYSSFHYYTKKNYHGAILLNFLSAYCGISAGQWNASLLLRDHGSKVFEREYVKKHLNDALLQGDNDTLFHLAKLAESEGKEKLAQDLFQRGFNSGDLRCLDPLIAMLSKENTEKAVHLLEYKKYLNDVQRSTGNQGMVYNFFSKMSANRNLAFLKMKKLLSNVFT